MRRMLKWSIVGVLGVVLVAAVIVGTYSVRVARQVASVERTIVVPLPTLPPPPTATTPPIAPPAVAAVSTNTRVPPTATAVPPTPTVVAPPSTGKVLTDGIKTGINGSD